MADLVFQYSPGALAGVKALGQGGPPEDNYYAIDILRIETTDKAGQGKVVFRIPSLPEYQQAPHEGEVWDWVKLVQLDNPGASTDIDSHNKWAAKNVRTILESIGYEPAVIDTGAPGNGWMVGRRAYVSYVAPQQGVSSFAETTYVAPRRFSDLKASGVKPTRRATSGAAENATAPPGGSGYAPPPPPPGAGAAQYTAPPPAPPTAPPTAGSVQNGYTAPPPAPTGYAAPPPPPPPAR
jgi:hypothetical protein